MVRYWRVLLRVMVVSSLALVIAVMVGLAAMRLSLPASACTVTESSIATLELEKMTGSDVASRLGCDGIHSIQFKSDDVLMETVSWRGDAWPYALFEAQLINGVLHGTKKIWLNLKVTFPQTATPKTSERADLSLAGTTPATRPRFRNPISPGVPAKSLDQISLHEQLERLRGREWGNSNASM